MNNFTLWWDGLLGIVWLLFWLLDIRLYLKTDILAPDICKLVAAGFGLRCIGGVNNIEIFTYLGSAMVCIAIYKIYKILKTNQKPYLDLER